jgi:glycosyltransferase involved in cell wall biosynthesis
LSAHAARPIGIIPFDMDEDNPASRMRGFAVAQALAKIGLDIAVINPEQVEECSLVIIGRYARFSYGQWATVVARARRSDTRIIFDLADNVYAWRGLSCTSVRQRRLLTRVPRYVKFHREERAMLRVLREVDHVTVSSGPLRDLTLPHNLACTVIPDIIGDEHFELLKQHRVVDPVRIVWTGYRDNLPHLEVVFAALQQLAPRGGFALRVVTAEKRTHPYRGSLSNREIVSQLPFPTEFVVWTREHAGEDICAADIGVAPLQPHAVKSANKAVLLMAMGLPVVASPGREYQRLIEHGRTGLLCATPEEWTDALDRLLGSPSLRSQMGAAGRRAVRMAHTSVAVAQQWRTVIERVLAQ